MMADSSVKPCNPSSHIITHVCLLQNCDEKLLCSGCHETHNGFHVAHVKPLNDILDFNSQTRVEEIKDMIGTASRSHEKMHNQFQLVAEKAKKDINMLIDKVMVPVYQKGNQESFQDLETVSTQLEDLKTKFVNFENKKCVQAKEILENYVEMYNNFHKNVDITMQQIQQKHVKSLTYKELELQINDLLNAVEESLLSFHKAFFNQPEPKQSDLEVIAADEDLSFQYDISKLKKELTLELSAPPNWNSIEYLSHSNLLITGDTTGNIKLWEPRTWKCMLTQSYHTSAINSIKYHQKSSRFFTASDDTTIKVSTIDTLPIIDTVSTLKGHKDKVWSLLIVEEQDTLYSSGSEPCVIGWDLNTLTVKHKLDTHGRDMTGTEMAFIPKLKLLAVSFKDGVINLYNIETPSGEVRSIKVMQKWLHCMHYVESRDELVVGTDVGTIKVWKVGDYTFELVRQHKISGELPTSLTLINDGNNMLVASGEHRLISLNLETGVYQTSENIECDKIKYIKVVPQIHRILLGNDNTKLNVLKL